MVWNAQLQTRGKLEYYCWCHGGNFQRRWTSSIPSHWGVESRILEKDRWKMYDPVQSGTLECRALISPNSLSKSAQYLRSSSELAWRIALADTCSNTLWHGEIRCEGERSIISKVGTARSGLLGVQTPRRNDLAAGDRLRFHHQRFEELSNEIQITKACESVGCMRRVSIGMYYQTIRDVNDGGGGKTRARREYSLLREDPDSELVVWIGGHQNCRVLQVKITCCVDQYGIEIQAPSISEDGSKSWISYPATPTTHQKVGSQRIIQASGGRTRYFQALSRLVRHGQPFRRFYPNRQKEVEWHSCRQWRQRLYLGVQNLENEFISWYNILTLPIEKRIGQFIGNRWVQGSHTLFSKKARRPSLILIGLIVFTKEAIKLDFNVTRTTTTFSCILAQVTGTLEVKWARLNWWAMSPFQWDGRISCITEDSLQVEGREKKGDTRYSSHQ